MVEGDFFIFGADDLAPAGWKIARRPWRGPGFQPTTDGGGGERPVEDHVPAEEAEDNEERWLRVFEIVPLPVAITDRERGEFLFVNQAFEAVLGYRREEVIGRTSVELGVVTPELRDRLGEIIRREGRASGVEVEVGAAGGRPVTALYYGELIEFRGRPRALGILLDLSDIRRRDDALRAAGRTLRLLTDNLKEAVMCYDMDRRLQYVNPAIETLTGYTVAELKREQFICWVHPDDRERMLAYWDRLFAGASYDNVEYRMVTKQGETKWVEAGWGPILDDRGRQVGVKGSERDISARKRAEQERAELAARLLQSQKIETVGRLAAGVAHDFNNLLTVISGYTVLALDHLQEDDSLRRPLQEVLCAAERASGLVRQLLAFGRGQVLRPETVSLGRILAEMEGTLRRLLGEAVNVRVDLAAGLRPLFADRRQVEQVFLNLAANARDAMPEGGTLTISAANCERPAGCPYCGAELKQGDFVAIEVRDTGSGMDEEVRRHAFEPFFTTKEPGKGTGLGLPTVHGIVTQSGGHVCIESARGRGTAFHVLLPAAAERS